MKIALHASTGWITAELGGDEVAGRVTANRAEIGSWETFTVHQRNGGLIALESVNGYFLCAEQGGGGLVVCNRPKIGTWEHWRPSGPLDDGARIFLTAASGVHNLGIDPGGDHVAHAFFATPQSFRVAVVQPDIVETLPPLVKADRFCRTADGTVVILKGASFFQAYQWHLDGIDIDAPMDELRALGANCVRVFGMDYNIPKNDFNAPPFDPRNYPNYLSEIPIFVRRCAAKGLYVYWSVFPDWKLIYGSKWTKALAQFFTDVCVHLKAGGTALGELTNEQDAHDENAVDPTKVTKPDGILSCSGSYGDLGGPQPHVWDFCDYHTPRRYPTHIKDSCVVDHPNYEQGAGVLLGEPDRFGSGGNLNADQARMSAGASRETAMGQFFHSNNGKHAKLMDDETKRCAEAFFSAYKGV